MSAERILFIQRRSSKAGAQTALLRLIVHPRLLRLRPVVVSASPGWLTEQCQRAGIPAIIEPFPSSRSLIGRLYANRSFARRILHRLKQAGYWPGLVQANDHLEGLLGLSVAKAAGVPAVVFLRSSEMTKRDFIKYGCHRFDWIGAAGDELAEKAREWLVRGKVDVLYDGLGEDDFFPPKTKSRTFPRKLLVVGSPSHYKGWQDFSQAILVLEQDPEFPALECDFTGEPPDPHRNDMQLGRTRRATFNFIGRVNDLPRFVRQYDLAIHPSREESFGLAPLEILAAGVPLICTRTGVIAKVHANSQLLCSPHDPDDLASVLRGAWKYWDSLDPALISSQRLIRRFFHLNQMVEGFLGVYRRLRGS